MSTSGKGQSFSGICFCSFSLYILSTFKRAIGTVWSQCLRQFLTHGRHSIFVELYIYSYWQPIKTSLIGNEIVGRSEVITCFNRDTTGMKPIMEKLSKRALPNEGKRDIYLVEGKTGLALSD